MPCYISGLSQLTSLLTVFMLSFLGLIMNLIQMPTTGSLQDLLPQDCNGGLHHLRRGSSGLINEYSENQRSTINATGLAWLLSYPNSVSSTPCSWSACVLTFLTHHPSRARHLH